MSQEGLSRTLAAGKQPDLQLYTLALRISVRKRIWRLFNTKYSLNRLGNKFLRTYDLPKSIAKLEVKHATQSRTKYIYLFKNMKYNHDRLVVRLADQILQHNISGYILIYLEALRQNTRSQFGLCAFIMR